ncbi:FAD-dependent pyridine nucleotide-disulfide oxidoreductase [Salinarchaeum sp. Harcht-Bsk1]|uniref:NAD(P)/FAD-dependent oxidoreductase n=1 Tax=Salinarchaeum sp. Harcht-Bsk1 TaxID=1333523 RepID=UPI0003424538|nr:FAD-dependent oxidoreductase [Salinarchaeum sp. Harcht-Bsk1]AGN02706.1 FAD-dependent pyridine nucleotide-disulfide oxidoreductase [Salinarchaeum sp. Harcht-Bsk1]
MRVLVLGGGYAGVTLTRKLERRLPDEHEIVLIDEDGQQVLQHELHRVVRRPQLAADIAVDLGTVLDRARLRVGTVDAIRPDDRAVVVEGETLEYDACAVAIGAAPSTAVEGTTEHGLPLKSLDDARSIHERATDVLDGTDGQIVVGGAGLSGIQVAGELAVLADRAAPDDGRATITVLEQEREVAPGFDAPFQSAIHSALESRGIEVRTDATIDRATADAVDLVRGESVPHDLLVWTGGITGQAAFDGDRPLVDARLRLGDRTFGLGDAVRVVDRDGQAVPATAQAAVREADTVATNVKRVLEGGTTFEPRLERFTFESPGWVVSIGNGAVAQVGPTVVTGTAAVAMKASVGVGYLSSVGALRDAVDLVNEELGLAVGRE